jgi:hypothetical protein
MFSSIDTMIYSHLQVGQRCQPRPWKVSYGAHVEAPDGTIHHIDGESGETGANAIYFRDIGEARPT